MPDATPQLVDRVGHGYFSANDSPVSKKIESLYECSERLRGFLLVKAAMAKHFL